jgi:hypothetical protein
MNPMNSTPSPTPTPPRPKSPFAQAPCLVVLLLAILGGLALLILSIVAPERMGAGWFRSGGASLAEYQVNDNLTEISDGSQHRWKIVYEKLTTSTFTGVIRHTSADRVPDFPLLSHDILVADGDYADPSRVKTSVSDHHFVWVSLSGGQPSGEIHLLHTVPRTDEIYAQLAALHNGQTVTVAGWEILRIDSYHPDGSLSQWWQDAGCNTLLVESVTVIAAP